jgi:hypothetical protein
LGRNALADRRSRFDLQAPIILTMLFVFSRISAPAMQLSQQLEQFASSVPAHAEVQQLDRELAPAVELSDSRTAVAIAPGAIVFRDVKAASRRG